MHVIWLLFGGPITFPAMSVFVISYIIHELILEHPFWKYEYIDNWVLLLGGVSIGSETVQSEY